MKHRIVISCRTEKSFRKIPVMMHLKKCIEATLSAERVSVPCEINVMVTDDKTIQALNRAARGIDRPTDVLSFPAFSFEPGKLPADTRKESYMKLSGEGLHMNIESFSVMPDSDVSQEYCFTETEINAHLISVCTAQQQSAKFTEFNMKHDAVFSCDEI